MTSHPIEVDPKDFQERELALYLLGLAVGRDSSPDDSYRDDAIACALVCAHNEIMRLSQVRTLEAEKLDREMKAILAERASNKPDITCPACYESMPWGTLHECKEKRDAK